MSEKRLTGRRVYEPTGEVRQAKPGEWWTNHTGSVFKADEPTGGLYPILRLVEDFHEIERPSDDAVALAKCVLSGTNDYHRFDMASEIISAEAAFAELDRTAPLPTAEFTRDPDPPRTLSFQEACELAIQRPGEWVAEMEPGVQIHYTSCFYIGTWKSSSSSISERHLTARWTPLVEVSQ